MKELLYSYACERKVKCCFTARSCSFPCVCYVIYVVFSISDFSHLLNLCLTSHWLIKISLQSWRNRLLESLFFGPVQSKYQIFWYFWWKTKIFCWLRLNCYLPYTHLVLVLVFRNFSFNFRLPLQGCSHTSDSINHKNSVIFYLDS